jgi:hypothetical protein
LLTRRYNVGVESRSIERKDSRESVSQARDPDRQPSRSDDRDSAGPGDPKTPPTRSRSRIYAAETFGLLLISALLLLITLIRYWHHIQWSAR